VDSMVVLEEENSPVSSLARSHPVPTTEPTTLQ